jgi:hypothetical protein
MNHVNNCPECDLKLHREFNSVSIRVVCVINVRDVEFKYNSVVFRVHGVRAAACTSPEIRLSVLGYLKALWLLQKQKHRMWNQGN